MGWITPTKPVITAKEAKEMENRLYSQHGMSQKKIAVFREIIKPHLMDAEHYGDPVGVSPEEIKEIVESLEKKGPHQIYSVEFSETEKAVIEKMMDDYTKLNR